MTIGGGGDREGKTKESDNDDDIENDDDYDKENNVWTELIPCNNPLLKKCPGKRRKG